MGGSMRHINKLIVHCTASPDYMDIGRNEIDLWHRARGWSGIGYHYVVRRNGEIEKGRPDIKVGAHARGANTESIGIVWVGTNTPSPEQESALISLVHYLMGKYNIKNENVLGHREAVVTDKTCPNLNMDRFRAELIFVQPTPKVR
jgi:N-acetylmuramoyl-L-alanine amidase